ncbi:hypothetical protein ACKI1O_26085 [Streptomyces scabiei]
MTLSSADLEAGVADDEVVGRKKRGPRARELAAALHAALYGDLGPLTRAVPAVT